MVKRLFIICLIVFSAGFLFAKVWDQYTDSTEDFADADTFHFLNKSDTTESAEGSINEATYSTLRSNLTRVYWVDASAADQGAAANSRSIKSLVDSIGTSKSATLVLSYSGTGNTTTYTLTTSETVPSNIALRMENGAIIDGAGTLTINGPLEAGPYQIFGSSITITLGTNISTVYPEMWGASGDGSTDDSTPFSSTITATLNTGIPIRLLSKTYVIGDIDVAGTTRDS